MNWTRQSLLIGLALVAIACSPSGAIIAEGDETPAPPAADLLTIMSPSDGTVVSEAAVDVTGTAPDGADVVREVRLGRDDHTTADGGDWSMQVELDAGENLLTFRIGEDETTSTTLRLIYEPGGSARPISSNEPEPSPDPVPTSEPAATDSAVTDLPVKVTKRTTSVPRNGTASVTIKTSKGATCSIEVVYNSGPSTAAGLGSEKADSAGSVTWKWKVGGRTARDTYPIYIDCTKGDREGSVETTFRVR